jgi:glycosyltransferase involved in cell wall biosynthesis
MRSGHESTGVTLLEGWTSRTLREIGIPVEVMPLRRAFDFGWPLRFARYLREQRADVVHAHEFAASCYAAMGALLAGVPLVCTIHGKNYWPDRYYRRAAFRRVLGMAHGFVAVSEDLRDFAGGVLAVDPARIHVIHNGVDGKKYARDPAMRTTLRRQLGLGDGDEAILAVGELSAVKGHEVLVRAASSLARTRPNIKVLIAGEGGERARLLELAAQLGFGERLHLLGFRRDVPALLAAADVFAMPSFSEGMPLAMIEAMASGVPIVASAVGGIPSLIAHGTSGLLSQAGDGDALASALRAMLSDPDARRTCAEAAHRRFLDHFSLTSMLETYRNMYESACASKPGRPAKSRSGLQQRPEAQ